MRCRDFALPLCLIAALLAAGCGSPPDKEIQQAQTAIDAAKAAGAADYAADEFSAAQNALKNANDAVEQRDYRLALNHALDARDRAQTAAKQTTERKAQMRGGADRAFGEASRALTDAQAILKAVESSRPAPRAVAEARRELPGLQHTLQEARAELDRGAFPAAIEHSKAVATRAQAIARDLQAKPSPTARRRR